MQKLTTLWLGLIDVLAVVTTRVLSIGVTLGISSTVDA